MDIAGLNIGFSLSALATHAGVTFAFDDFYSQTVQDSFVQMRLTAQDEGSPPERIYVPAAMRVKFEIRNVGCATKEIVPLNHTRPTRGVT